MNIGVDCSGVKLARYRQQGQAMPLVIAFLLLVALTSIVYFNTAKVADEKTRVANSADAAVYSGLIWQARSLNFQAYTNRAMVANQVSMAQLVSLSSWANYGKVSARNLDTAIGWIPPVAPFTEALAQGADQLDSVVAQIASIGIPVIDNINGVLSYTQEGVYNASYLATPQVISSVVKANDARFRASSTFSVAAELKNAAAWHRLSQRQSSDFDVKHALVNASLDEFSSGRGWGSLPGLPAKVYVSPVDRFRIVKEGTTKLVDEDGYQWRGKDGLSLHWEHFSCGTKGCGWQTQEIPMGWGQSVSDGNGYCSGGECGDMFTENSRAELFANEQPQELDTDYSGLRAYRALRAFSSTSSDPRLSLAIEVDVAESDVRTAEKIQKLGSPSPPSSLKNGLEPGMFYTDDAYASGSIASVSAGEVFFKRPVLKEGDELRVDGEVRHEHANLFNPYWDVRLIDVDAGTRQTAWLIRSPGMMLGATLGKLSSKSQASHILSVADISSGNLQGYYDKATDAVGKLGSIAASGALKNLGVGIFKSYTGTALANYEDNGGDAALQASSSQSASQSGENYEETKQLLDQYASGNDSLSDTLLANASIQDMLDSYSQTLGEDAVAGIRQSVDDSFSQENSLMQSLLDLAKPASSAENEFESQQRSDALIESSQQRLQAGLAELEAQYPRADFSMEQIRLGNILDNELNSINKTLQSSDVDRQQTVLNTQAYLRDSLSGLSINEDSVRQGVLENTSNALGRYSEQLQRNQNNVQHQQFDVAQDAANSLVDQLLNQQRQRLGRQSMANE